MSGRIVGINYRILDPTWYPLFAMPLSSQVICWIFAEGIFSTFSTSAIVGINYKTLEPALPTLDQADIILILITTHT